MVFNGFDISKLETVYFYSYYNTIVINKLYPVKNLTRNIQEIIEILINISLTTIPRVI